MNYLYIDFECHYDPRAGLSLKDMALFDYIDRTHVTMLAFAENQGPAAYVAGDGVQDRLEWLRAIAESPDWTVVAHNAAFDLRIWHRKLGLPWPRRAHCSLELCMAAFPHQAGGYSLKSLGRTLPIGMAKLEVDLARSTGDELARYCMRDVELCRAIHGLCLPRLSADEIAVAELTQAARELNFVVDSEAVVRAIDGFTAVAASEVAAAVEGLGRDGSTAFGMDGDQVRSIKPHKLKELLRDRLGFDTQSISEKKINPEKLRRAPEAAAVLQHTSAANKVLSHKRRVRGFVHSSAVPLEWGYFRAGTGRFSSPAVGRGGLNVHNIPKRNKTLAKLIRTMFQFPDGLCAVRADEANVEYRVLGLLAGCEHTDRIFSADPLADPYLAFGNIATGREWQKSDPIRQVFKAAVLGLGFGMGLMRYTEELLKMLSDPSSGVTVDDMVAVCKAQGWSFPTSNKMVKGVRTKLSAPDAVCTVAYYTRELFHEIHPEFMRLARWLERTVSRAAAALAPERVIEEMYTEPSAPDRALVNLEWDTSFGPGVKSVRVTCGPWSNRTVVWRDLGIRDSPFGVCLTALTEKKGYRPLTLSLYIENIVQSAARNATCQAHLELARRGFPYQFGVHDELLLIVPKEPDWVLRARDAIVDVLGPNKLPGWKWSVMVNPKEINVSRTLYEVDMDKLHANWWTELPAKPGLLENLP